MTKDKKNEYRNGKAKEAQTAQSEPKTMAVVAVQNGQYRRGEYSELKSKGQAFIIDKDDYESVAHWVELQL